jgi:hypothetical protein
VGLSYGIASGALKGKMKPCQLAARHSRAIAGGPILSARACRPGNTKGRPKASRNLRAPLSPSHPVPWTEEQERVCPL